MVCHFLAQRICSILMANPVHPVYLLDCFMPHLIRLLTRESALALTQAKLVKTALEQAQPGFTVELHPTKSLGDKYRDRWEELARGDRAELTKRKWTFELEEAIAHGEADLAVHSAKDLPLDVRSDTALLPVLPREDERDVFIGKHTRFAALPQGACIGTDSKRRRAQLLRLRPDVRVVPHDGNVPTRLAKLEASDSLDGIVLAAAGLARLNLTPPWLEFFAPEAFVPAAHQGILAAQHHVGNVWLATLLQRLADARTHAVWLAERAAVVTLQADCETAIGAWARVEGANLHLLVRGLSPNGSRWIEERATAPLDEAEQLGQRVAETLLQRGIQDVLRYNT